MNLQIRLFRKPFTTVLWVTLVTAMTVLLCIGGALWYSSESVAGIIDDLHATVAYRTDRAYIKTDTETGVSYQFENKSMSSENREFLESLDCVQSIDLHTLTGGYSPVFQPLISTGAFYMVNESYDDVIALVTVMEVEMDEAYSEKLDISRLGLDMPDIVETGYLDCKVHVEEYLVGIPEYLGIGTPIETYDLILDLQFLNREDRDWIEVGKQYLISGEYMRDNFSEPFIGTPSHLVIEGNSLRGCTTTFGVNDPDNPYEPDNPDYIMAISHWNETDLCMAKLDGTVEEFLADPANAEWLEIFDIRQTAQHSIPILGTDSLESMYQFANSKASVIEGRAFTAEEYESGARVCLISNTLAEKSGIQLGDTIPISQFWCVDPADEHGVENYSTDRHSTDGKLNNPTIGSVQSDTKFITNGEEFTVVGIYRQSNEWGNGSYDVTPNTVLIPRKAQIPGGYGGFFRVEDVTYTDADGEEVSTVTSVQDATWGVYLSIRLKNGMADDFKKAIAGTGLENQFVITDQGYGAILGSIRGIAQSARELLGLIGAGWALLLLLYMLLYQGMQKRNLGIMRALGATPREAGGYLWLSGMAVAATGVALGTLISVFVLDYVETLLFDAATYSVPLTQYSTGGQMSQSMLQEMLAQSQLSIPALLLMALAQIALFALVLRLQAWQTAKREPRILLTA